MELFLKPTIYTAATNLFGKSPHHLQLSIEQMLKSIFLSPTGSQWGGGSRSDCRQLLELHTFGFRLCPEAAASLPCSLLRTIMIFRGIMRLCIELLNNEH